MPIAFIFMLVGVAILMPTMFMVLSSTTTTIKGTATAEQMKAVISAAKGYITANAALIEAGSTATTPYTVQLSTLVQQGYLPNGFMGYSNTGACTIGTGCYNPYGQSWVVQILQPAANNLQALVLSVNGQNITPKDMGQISSIAGAEGGVVGGSVGTLPEPCASGEICGTSAGWQIPVGSFSATPGHLAGLIEYNNNSFQSDYLYRVAVPGQPQLNTMNTNLDMGANTINNAQNVNVNQDVTIGNPGPSSGGSTASLPGQLGVNETAGQNMPSGWGGGIHTWDIYANGTFAAGENGTQGAFMNDSNGGMYNGGQVAVYSPNSANYAYMYAQNGNTAIVTNGEVLSQSGSNYAYMNAINNNTSGSPEILTNGIIDATNGVGVGNYFSTYNGNWWADNTGNSSQAGNSSVSGQVSAGNIYISGSTGTNDPSGGNSGYLGFEDNPNVVVNGPCGDSIGEPAAALASDAQGQILSCYGGHWQALGGNSAPLQMYSADLHSGQTFPGQWQFCAVTDGFSAWVNIYPIAGPYSNGTYTWGAGSGRDNYATVFTCYNLPGVYVSSNP